MENPPNQTIYINNLNEKVKKEGEFIIPKKLATVRSCSARNGLKRSSAECTTSSVIWPFYCCLFHV